MFSEMVSTLQSEGILDRRESGALSLSDEVRAVVTRVESYDIELQAQIAGAGSLQDEVKAVAAHVESLDCQLQTQLARRIDALETELRHTRVDPLRLAAEGSSGGDVVVRSEVQQLRRRLDSVAEEWSAALAKQGAELCERADSAVLACARKLDATIEDLEPIRASTRHLAHDVAKEKEHADRVAAGLERRLDEVAAEFARNLASEQESRTCALSAAEQRLEEAYTSCVTDHVADCVGRCNAISRLEQQVNDLKSTLESYKSNSSRSSSERITQPSEGEVAALRLALEDLRGEFAELRTEALAVVQRPGLSDEVGALARRVEFLEGELQTSSAERMDVLQEELWHVAESTALLSSRVERIWGDVGRVRPDEASLGHSATGSAVDPESVSPEPGGRSADTGATADEEPMKHFQVEVGRFMGLVSAAVQNLHGEGDRGEEEAAGTGRGEAEQPRVPAPSVDCEGPLPLRGALAHRVGQSLASASPAHPAGAAAGTPRPRGAASLHKAIKQLCEQLHEEMRVPSER